MELMGKQQDGSKNWLEDRQQTVVLDGVSSEAVSVDSGSFAIVRYMMVSSAKRLTLEVSLDWRSLM
jgi:hypothetical protein